MSRRSSSRPGRTAGAALACAALLALAGAGCGNGDDEEAPTTTPTVEPASPTGPTGPAAKDEGKPAEDDGGVDLEEGTVTPPPESGSQATGGSSAPQDSPENDTAPEPGSAEEAFEQFCDENPDACG